MTPAEFERKIAKDLARLKKHASEAVARTAKKAVPVIQKNVPVAFGELRDSVHATDAKTVVSAPHAQAVEVGSRPHLVPLEDLVKWVKLRGMQGLSEGGRVRNRNWKATGMGTTTAHQARTVAMSLKQLESGKALSIDAPEKVAKAIQMAILKHGTKPHHPVFKSLPEVASILDAEMKKVFT